MKYSVTINKLKNIVDNKVQVNNFWLADHTKTRINKVIQVINRKYINYYIKLMEKREEGKTFRIYVGDNYDLPNDYIEVEYNWSYGCTYKEGRSEEKIETEELLEFFKIVKKELEIGDEIIEDTRVDDVEINPIHGLNLLSEIQEVGGVSIVNIEVVKSASIGYMANLDVFVNGKKQTIRNKVLWKDTLSKNEINNKLNNAYKTGVPVPASEAPGGVSNIFKGSDGAGNEIYWYNETLNGVDENRVKGKLTSGFPKLNL